MENKIRRYLELSKEFTVKSHEVYDGFVGTTYSSVNFDVTGVTGSNTYNVYPTQSSVTVNTTKLPSKLEQFETAQLEKIAKVKRYEEYLQLQTDLLEYHTAKEKLNN